MRTLTLFLIGLTMATIGSTVARAQTTRRDDPCSEFRFLAVGGEAPTVTAEQLMFASCPSASTVNSSRWSASIESLIADEQAAYKRVYNARESVDGKADNVSGQTSLRGTLNQLRKLEARYPHLKVLVSIGGASPTNATGFSLASRTEPSRQKFVTACVDLFIRGNLLQGISARGLFDGIDIDWESQSNAKDVCLKIK